MSSAHRRLRAWLFAMFLGTVAVLAGWPTHAAPQPTGITQPTLAIAPRSSGDNGAAVSAALTNAAGKATVLIRPGTYGATTPIVLPSNSTVSAGPGITYNAAPTTGPAPGIGWTDAAFVAGPGKTTALTTLSADVTVGSTTVSVATTTGLVVGNWIALYRGAGDMAESYQVASISAGTPGSITVDRPIYPPFKSADVVYGLVPNTNIRLDLGGATFNVTSGSRTWWLPYCVGCEVANATFYMSSTVFGADYDIGAVRTTMRGLRAVFVANTPAAFSDEWAEDSLIDGCFADGGFAQGYRISGRKVVVRNSGAKGYTQIGLALQESGTQDIGAANQCRVEGGTYWGGQYGVQIRSNSSGNELHEVTAGNASVAGFQVAAGTATAITTGTSLNTLRGCRDKGSALGLAVGDGASGADGTVVDGFTSDGATTTGILVQSDATNTTLRGAAAINGTNAGGYGISLSGTVTMVGARSAGNQGRGLYCAGNCVVNGFVSYRDGAAGGGRDAVRADGTGSLTLIGATLTDAPGVQWNGFYNNSAGLQILQDVTINMAGSGGVAVYAVAAGTLRLRDVRVTEAGSGNYGLYIAAGSVEIGPGCSFSATSVPYTNAGGTVSMQQTGGTVSPTLVSGGNVNLTFEQNYAAAIQALGALTGAATVTPLAIPGLEFTFCNGTTGGQLVGLKLTSTVNVAAGKCARIRVSSTPDVVRVSPDT